MRILSTIYAVRVLRLLSLCKYRKIADAQHESIFVYGSHRLEWCSIEHIENR